MNSSSIECEGKINPDMIEQLTSEIISYSNEVVDSPVRTMATVVNPETQHSFVVVKDSELGGSTSLKIKSPFVVEEIRHFGKTDVAHLIVKGSKNASAILFSTGQNIVFDSRGFHFAMMSKNKAIHVFEKVIKSLPQQDE